MDGSLLGSTTAALPFGETLILLHQPSRDEARLRMRRVQASVQSECLTNTPVRAAICNGAHIPSPLAAGRLLFNGVDEFRDAAVLSLG